MLNKVLTLVLLLFISLGGYLWYRQSPYADEKESTEAVLGVQEAVGPLVVKDQFAVDDFLIDSVQMDKPGFIAIHASFEGKPGPVIAHSALVDIGIQKDLVILIPKPLDKGSQVFVMIHEDDGDGVWEFPGDDVFRLENGMPLVRTVTIQ